MNTEVEVAQGTGLVFKALPIAFGKMGLSGVIVAILFFIGLAFARDHFYNLTP